MGQRLAGLAVVVGGALLALNYLFWTGNGLAPDRINAAPDGPAGMLVLVTIGLGTLLLTLGMPTLMQRQYRRLTHTGVFGGWLLVFGFLLWAVGALAGPSILVFPWWLGEADQVMVTVGSVLFGVASYRAGVLPRGAALVVAICGLLGLLPSALPDLLFFLAGIDLNPGAAFRVLGFVALLLFGLGWVRLGYAVWRPSQG
jgi:hypothetical protein